MLPKRKKNDTPIVSSVQTFPDTGHPFRILDRYTPLLNPELRLYETMREAIPIIDAALYKIQRLIGGFRLRCKNEDAERDLNYFASNVRVGSSMQGLEMFICSYFDSLLLYGNALGEIVLTRDNRQIAALYNAAMKDVAVERGASPLELNFFTQMPNGELKKVTNNECIMFTALNPPASQITGVSVLRSLPFVSSVLLKIYNSIGQNFDRVGNVRFAVTYNPGADAVDKAYAKEHAKQIAKEWSQGMRAGKNGETHDFIAVGDIGIKVIGAENQMIDCNIPARHMMEQIIAKLSLPPFLLGLSWSTTERMSKQQADILANELSYYRRMLVPVIKNICRMFLRLNGYYCEPEVEWDVLSFDDEIDAARSRLYNAQAAKIELENGIEPSKAPVNESEIYELKRCEEQI
ncbi:MAG: phage portal protein [Oscillospiraceae bacterium]|nr:phage portal protein [Oscillospiraceae bacterium]